MTLAPSTIDDDGSVIRMTVRGSTYVFRDETARIVREQRAQHPDGTEASAFWHGFLTAISMAFSPPNGKA